MYNILPQIIFIFSLVGIIVILSRRLPRAMEMGEGNILGTRVLLVERLFGRIHLYTYKQSLFRFLEKMLRRFVILSLKAGNVASRGVEAVRERSKHLRPPFIEELIRRGDRLLSRREVEYIEAIKQNPQDIEAYRKLGYLYIRRGRFTDARLSFEHILKINPNDDDAKERMREIDERTNEPA